ncbi:recombinase family protein [Anaerobacillus sp. CMMVII]|uniref:recombinase family protein n=1 Tax=Anaerobacillus sp. CMMVII TaxID=2755588 RepID=UPI0021B6EC36|nr:recombinase family protein [Anaerobacillus sp. CMMVII]MCT8138591.1 recombinase family protein [Anaerobacillus sp. CMMVII]
MGISQSTLRENNVRIAEPGSLTDLANEDQEFISDIKNLIAKREKKAIVKRMMRGKRQRMREGKPWGKAPIGYIYNKAEERYELDDKWSWVIPYIDKLYLEEQLGMKLIADKLNEISRTPNGTLWNETLVYRRLVSKAFHGVMEKNFSNGEIITIEGIYPQLRTLETYEKIQEERNKRGIVYKATSRRKDNIHILRRTVSTCGICGRKVSLHQNGKADKPTYYLKHGRKMKLKDETTCDISINTKRFEHNLIQAIKDILSGEEQAKNYIKLEVSRDDIKDLESQISNLDKITSDRKEKLDRLLDLYLDGAFKKEVLQQKQKDIEKEYEIHSKEKQQLVAKYEALKKKEWNYEMVYNYLEFAEDFDTELTHLEQTKLVGDLFPGATLFQDKIVLKAEINGEIPVDITIPIDPDLNGWHHTKQKWYKDKYAGSIK